MFCFRYAETLNRELVKQRHILADKCLKLHNESVTWGDNCPMDRQMIDRCVLVMESVLRSMNCERFAVKLFGIPIDTSVTGVLAAVGGAVGFACVRFITQQL